MIQALSDHATEILRRKGADLGDYLSHLQIERDASVRTRRVRGKLVGAEFEFGGTIGRSQSSIDNAARDWARSVLRREEAF